VNDPLRAQQMVRRQVRRRRLWRRLRIAVLVVVTSAVVLAAAFGIDRLVVVAHKFYTEHHHSSPPAKAVTNHVTSTTTSTVPGPPRCTSPEVSAVVSDWRETAGTVEETVTLTNVTLAPCTLDGYPVLGAGAQNGTPLPAPNSDVAGLGATSAFGTPLPATPVTVAHGATASFELTYANVCGVLLQPGQAATGVPHECYDGLWLEVTPTPGSSPLVVTEPLRLTYATSGFEVGPFQAGGGAPLVGQPPPTAQTTSPTDSVPSP
jgi:hypothetical protein